jgi:hypothetical protein
MKVLYVLLCVTFPIAWGLLVNWLFQRPGIHRPKPSPDQHDEPPFPDYQI